MEAEMVGVMVEALVESEVEVVEAMVAVLEDRAKIVKTLPTDHKMIDVGKAAGEQWRNLPAAAKKPYEDKFQKLMVEFRKAMEEYKKTNGGDEDEEEDEEEEENAAAKKKARAGA